jgi:hypothetical protein
MQIQSGQTKLLMQREYRLLQELESKASSETEPTPCYHNPATCMYQLMVAMGGEKVGVGVSLCKCDSVCRQPPQVNLHKPAPLEIITTYAEGLYIFLSSTVYTIS